MSNENAESFSIVRSFRETPYMTKDHRRKALIDLFHSFVLQTISEGLDFSTDEDRIQSIADEVWDFIFENRIYVFDNTAASIKEYVLDDKPRFSDVLEKTISQKLFFSKTFDKAKKHLYNRINNGYDY